MEWHYASNNGIVLLKLHPRGYKICPTLCKFIYHTGIVRFIPVSRVIISK